ncbi:hypothetical protein V2J09_005090 [Rumex salicifolius]
MANHLIPFAFAILLHLAVTPAANAVVLVASCNNTDGNYTANSPYEKNLDSLFTKTAATNLDYGFYNFTAGKSPDKAHLVSLCIGNVNVTACHTCQKLVTDTMKKACPTQKTAILWSDNCMVRYSTRPIFGSLAVDPAYYMLNNGKVSDDTVEEYSGAVKALLEGLPGNASAGSDRIKFASAKAEFSSSITLYAMGQCTPDLSRNECSNCIGRARDIIQTCDGCKGKRGARALLPSCTVRFEEYPFYLSSDSPVSSPSHAPGPSSEPAGPSLPPDMAVSPSLAPDSTMSPSLAPDSTMSPSLAPDSTMSPSLAPNHDDVVNTTKVASPSPSSIGNAASKERIGRRSLIWAIAVVGACFSALL